MASNEIFYETLAAFEGPFYKVNGELLKWVNDETLELDTMTFGIYDAKGELKEVMGFTGDNPNNLPECTFSFLEDGVKLYAWMFDNPLTLDSPKNDDLLGKLIDLANYTKELDFDLPITVPDDVEFPFGDPTFWNPDSLITAEPIADDVSTIDAEVVSSDILKRKITLASAKGRNERRWKNNTSTVADFLQFLSTHEVNKEKDGFAILQGSLVGVERKATAVKQLDLMILDLDTGESMSKIEKRIRELGLFCVMYTTHSHLKPSSDVKLDTMVKYVGDDRDITIEDIKDYLITEKRYQPEILEGASIDEPEHKKDGIVYVVKHQPMPKFRLVFLLDEPFIIAQRGGSQKQAIEEWKGRYVGLANLLHAAYDRSCVDPSRLMYTPRHPPGAKGHSVKVIAGKPLDVDSVNLGDFKGKARPTNAFTAAGSSSDDKEYQNGWLLSFAAKYSDRFEAADFCAEYYDVRDDKGDKIETACPNDDAHSDAGNSEDKGFFCVNASESSSGTFMLKCMHDSCADLDRLGLLDVACTEHNLSMKDLKEYLVKIEGEDDEEEPEVVKEGERPADYKTYEEALNYIQSFKDKSLDHDKLKRLVKFLGHIPPRERDSVEQAAIMSEVFKKSTLNKSDINKALKAEVQKAKEENLDGYEDEEFSSDVNKAYREKLDKMCKSFALVSLGPAIKVAEIRESKLRGRVPVIITHNPDAFKLKYLNDTVKFVSDGETRRLPLGDAFLQYPKRKAYNMLVFEPDEAASSSDDLNVWSGFPVQSKKGEFPLIHRHIWEVLCQENEEYYNWLMTWLAHIIQVPAKKPGSAVVIKGEKGTGKSIIFEKLMQRLLYDYYIKCSNSRQITANFNFQFHSKLFVLLEEAVWGGDANAEGVLKDMITSETMQYEKKGETSYIDSSYLRMVMLSNNDWVVPASHDERRFFVLCASDKYMQQHDYFEPLEREIMSDKAVKAFMWELENWEPVGGWSILYTPPKTPWLHEQQSFTNSGMDEFFLNILDSNQLEEDDRHNNKPQIEFSDTEPTRFPKQAFKNHFVDFMSRGSTKGRGTLANWKKYTDKWFGIDVVAKTRDRENVHGTMIEYLTVPPLDDIRARAKKKGLIQ